MFRRLKDADIVISKDNDILFEWDTENGVFWLDIDNDGTLQTYFRHKGVRKEVAWPGATQEFFDYVNEKIAILYEE